MDKFNIHGWVPPQWLGWLIIAGVVLGALYQLMKVLSTLNELRKEVRDSRANLDFSRIIPATTYPGELITEGEYKGCRRLYLDTNIDEARLFDIAIGGKNLRLLMNKAAMKCSWEIEQRFVLVGRAHEMTMRGSVINWLAKGLWSPKADDLVYFSVTGADADPHIKTKRCYRVILTDPADYDTYLNHPVDKWLYQDDELPGVWKPASAASHHIRLETVRYMAESMKSSDRRVTLGVNGNKESHRIVFWMRGKIKRSS